MKLEIETWAASQVPNAAVRIKRRADGLFLDAADGVFKGESDCRNVWVKLLPIDSPNCKTVASAVLDSAGWADGDYVIYYHDISMPARKIYDVNTISVFGGDATTPGPTAIAVRIVNSQLIKKIASKVGAL